MLQTESVLGWQTFVNRDGDSWNDVNCGNQRGLSTQETGGYQAEGGAKMLSSPCEMTHELQLTSSDV